MLSVRLALVALVVVVVQEVAVVRGDSAVHHDSTPRTTKVSVSKKKQKKATPTPIPTITPVPSLTFSPTPIPTPGPTSKKNPFDASKVEWRDIWTTLEVNAILFVLLLGLFELKRGASHRRVYSPRWLYYKFIKRAPGRVTKDDGTDPPGAEDSAERRFFERGKIYCLPCALLWSLQSGRAFRWIKRACATNDDELRRMIGLDAYLVLRFCRMWKRLFFWGSVLGVGALLPVYASGRRQESGFYRLTMRNLKKGQDRLWAPVCFVWVFSLLILRALERETRAYLKYRREFLAGLMTVAAEDAEFYQARCSVVVERVPPRLRSDRALKAYFAKICGGNVHSAVVYLDLRDLEAKMRRRDRAARVLKTRLIDAAARAGRPGPQEEWVLVASKSKKKSEDDEVDEREYVVGGPSHAAGATRCGCFTRVDALRYRSARLDAYDEAFVAARDKALADEGTSLNEVGDAGVASLFFARRRDEYDSPDYFFDHSPFAWFLSPGSTAYARRHQKTLAAAAVAGTASSASSGGPQRRRRTSHPTAMEMDDGLAEGDLQGLRGPGPTAALLDSDTNANANANTHTNEANTDDGNSSTIASYCASCWKAIWGSAARTTVRTAGDLTTGLATTLGLDDALMTRYYERSSTGVVTFDAPGQAADVAQLALTSEARGLEATLAPPVSDIYWRNVGVSLDSSEYRGFLADVWLWFFAALWTPIVIFFQTLSNLDEIAKFLPFLKPFVRKKKYAYARTLVTGYIPVVLLLGLLALIPIVLEYLALSYVRLKSQADTQRWVLSRNFYFQLLSVFVTVLAGSITSTLKEFVRKPSSILRLLGKSLPNISAYFMQTLVTKCLFSLSNELARPLPYFLSSVRSKFDRYIAPMLRGGAGETSDEGDSTNTAASSSAESKAESSSSNKAQQFEASSSSPAEPREASSAAEDLDDQWAPPEFRVGRTGVEFLLVALIGITYAPIAPLILLFAFAFFAFAEVVFTHQFLYVYVNNFEAGGVYLWPALTFFTTLALVASQLTTISYLGILNGVRQAPALAPVPFLTIFFYTRLVRFYEAPGKHLDRETAAQYDLNQPGPNAAHLRPDLYRHPALVTPSITSASVRRDLFGGRRASPAIDRAPGGGPASAASSGGASSSARPGVDAPLLGGTDAASSAATQAPADVRGRAVLHTQFDDDGSGAEVV